MSPRRMAMMNPRHRHDLGEQGCRPLAVAGVARPDLDAKHQFAVLVADDVELVAVEAPGGRLAAVAHLGVGVADGAVAGHALADLGAAVVSFFYVVADDLGQQASGFGHRRVVDAFHLGQQRPPGGHQLAQVGLALHGILPVDVGLGPAERLGGLDHLGAQAVTGRFHCLAEEAPDELVGVTQRPGAVHRGGVDDGGEGPPEDFGLHRLLQRGLEQRGIGVMHHHARTHQAEGPGGDAGELVVDAHGRLPVRIHPGAPGGLGIRGLVVGGAEHGPHHHRRRDGGPSHPRGVQLGEVVVGDDLMAVVGQPLVERALRHDVSSHMTSFEERTLRSNTTEQRDPRGSGELRHCHSLKPESRSRVPQPTFCRLT